MKRSRCSAWLVAALLGAAGCAHQRAGEQALDAALAGRRIVLFGEVHDNAVQHEMRRAALERWIAAGARPVFVMEHFDRDRQAELDRALAAEEVTAQQLIDAAGGRGWNWRLIEPTLRLAIRHRLPIVAANVSRDEARRVAREGLGAIGLDAQIAADIASAQSAEIVASHCGQVDAVLAARMMRAQVARDRVMAAALERHAVRHVVLLAGNGHVRRDIGVPRWLAPAAAARVRAVGFLETGSPEPAAGQFDHVVRTARAARPDPCEAFKRSRPAPVKT
jgi:uncharacterized iron-regulated protein